MSTLPDRTSAEKAKWDQWRESDYSWSGLLKKEIIGGGQNGEKCLQDYWRLDAATGRSRTDDELLEVGEIVEFQGTLWHIAHLPTSSENEGEFTWKAEATNALWDKLWTILQLKIEKSGPSLGSFDWYEPTSHFEWLPNIGDSRALFEGVIVRQNGRRIGRGIEIYLNLKRAIILDDFDVEGLVFGEGSDFEYCSFLGSADFAYCKFNAYARFVDCAFLGRMNFFFSVEFGGDLGFTECIVIDKINFEYSKFLEVASFRSSKFYSNTAFDRSEFCGGAAFTNVEFYGDVSFFSAVFHKSANFSGDFVQRASFVRARFEGAFGFSAKVQLPERNFSGAFYSGRFLDVADFSGAVGPQQAWRLSTAFGEAQFEKALILSDGLDGRSKSQSKNLLKAILDQKDGEELLNQRLAELESGCRTVKIAMSRARDEIREQAYYRIQLTARLRRTDIDIWERIVGSLYKVSSEFGSSVSRPIGFLVLLTLAFSIAYWVWGWSFDVPGSGWRDGPYHGLSLALRGVFPPFSAMNIEPKAVTEGGASWQSMLLGINPAVTFGVKVAIIIQSILSSILIFLFGLALKRRFQMT